MAPQESESVSATKFEGVDFKKIDVEKGNDDDDEPASFTELFQFCNQNDKKYLGVGIFMSVLSGANQPANLILFGEVLNSLQQPGTDEDEVTEKINFLALMYLVIATQMFITQFIQTAAMTMASANQTKTMREE